MSVNLPDAILPVPLRTRTILPAQHTNAYLVGMGESILIDPGASDPEEQQQLEKIISERTATIKAVVLTHHHSDHVGGLDAITRVTSAPVWAHPRTADFLGISLDRELMDDDTIPLGGFSLRVLHTPGHASDHLCFYEEQTRVLFSGDVVVGEGTVVINPPDGNMTQYLTTLRKLQGLGSEILCPGHGPVSDRPESRIRAYIVHRHQRERAIVSALESGADTPEALVEKVYGSEIEEKVYPLAARSVLAHLIKLREEERAEEAAGRWRLTE